MSFFYQKSLASNRSHRTKEKETRPRASSQNPCGHRKTIPPKDNDNEMLGSKSPILQTSLQDQNDPPPVALQASSGSEPLSPGAPIDNTFQKLDSALPSSLKFSSQAYTPIALQQYLEQNLDDEEQCDPTASVDVSYHPNTSHILDTATSIDQVRVGELSAVMHHAALFNAPFLPSEQEEPFDDQSKRGRHLMDAKRVNDASHQQDSKAMEQPESKACGKVTEAGNESTLSNHPIGTKASEPRIHDKPKRGTSTRSRPVSQIVSGSGIASLSKSSSDSQPAMFRTVSHSSAPLLSRAFTPPPPPLNANQAPPQLPTSFVSPVPLRFQPPVNNYSTYNPAPVQYHLQQHFQAANHPYHYPVQVRHDAQQEAAATLPWQYVEVDHSAMAPPGNVRIYERRSEDLLKLLVKLQAALPELQTIIRGSQQMRQGSNARQHQSTNGNISTEHGDNPLPIQHRETRHRETKTQHTEEVAVLRGEIGQLQAKVKHLELAMSEQQKAMNHLREELMTLCAKSVQDSKSLAGSKDDTNRTSDL